MIKIRNEGTKIVATNYFDSDFAKAGLLFMSKQGNTLRLLVPSVIKNTTFEEMKDIIGEFVPIDSGNAMVNEMGTPDHVVISRGPSKQYQRQDMLEILFEDFSNTPFSLFMETDQCDFLPANKDSGYEMELSVWTVNGQQKSIPCYFRPVKNIPCLKPFPSHKRKIRS